MTCWRGWWTAALVLGSAACGVGPGEPGGDTALGTISDAVLAADDAAPRDAAADRDADVDPDAGADAHLDGPIDGAPDAGVVADATAPTDAGPEPADADRPPADGAPADAAPDAGPADAATPDAASALDAAADALADAAADAAPPPPPVPDAATPDLDAERPPDAAVVVCGPPPPVFINEVVAANRSGLLDEDGDTPDWIELYNGGDAPISLHDWGLSDDPEEPFRWRLPNRSLPPGGRLLVLASGKAQSPAVTTWDTRVDLGDRWRYLPVAGPTDPGWMRPGFNDAGWAEGPSGFGHGDGDDATHYQALTLYVRRTVHITEEELGNLQSLLLHVDYDDAFVAYLNGVEVARSLIGFRGGPAPHWTDLADGPHEASLYRGHPPEAFGISDLDLLVPGDNVLAIELHDEVNQPDDATLIPFLTLGFADVRPGMLSPHLGIVERFHASFAISASGETLTLTRPDGCEVDRVRTGPLREDVSFGRTPDGSPRFGYFLEPTPGAPNDTEARDGFAAVTLSPRPGYHPGGAFVNLDADPPRARVHYTVDGSEPGPEDPVFEGSIVLGPEAGALVVRARAYADDLWPGPAVTGTFIAGEPPALPTISLATDPANLWDSDTGIYVHGDTYQPNFPHFGSNFWEDWERPLNVDFWEPDQARGFQLDCGVKIHGGWSRANRQRSLRLIMRSEYGTSALEYPLFEGNPVLRYKRLVLRNGGQDWAGCNAGRCAARAHLRDAVMHQIAAGLGTELLAYRPVITYLNGEYWGLYNLRERFDRHYLETRFGHEDIDLLDANAQVLEGDAFHYESLLQVLRQEDIARPDVYERVQGMMDTDNFATYSILQIFYDNRDWPGNNIKFWRPRTPDGRWRWLMFDSDFGLGLTNGHPSLDTVAFALRPDGPGWPNPPWSTELLRGLVRNPTFANDFVNRFADYLNTVFRPEVTRPILERTAAVIAPEMSRQLARWGSEGVPPAQQVVAWEQAVAAIGNWLQARPGHIWAHLAQNFGLAGTWQLQLSADPPGSGVFVLTAVTVDGPFTGRYFRGVPVTVTAVPAPGFELRGWSIDDLGAEPTVVLSPDGDLSLTARFE